MLVSRERAALLESRHQPRERAVDLAQRSVDLRRIRTVIVTGMVDLLEIERVERRLQITAKVEPRQQLIDAPVRRHASVEMQPVARPHAVDRDVGSGPEHRRGMPALFFDADPERLAAPPRGIRDRLLILVDERLAARRIDHAVVDDAVMIRIEAGHQRVVVRKRQRRERRLQRVGANAARRRAMRASVSTRGRDSPRGIRRSRSG